VLGTAEINSLRWSTRSPEVVAGPSAKIFVCAVLGCVCLAAVLAGWLPLQASVVTLFLFAGPHNWFELRYFLQRMPVRFGQSRAFFLTAFAGMAFLTISYFSLPWLYTFSYWPNADWSIPIAIWNTLLLLWVGTLVWLRGKQKPRSDWSWGIPATLFLISVNWLVPELFSLGIVYLHPLIALWFLDRHLQRTRPAWLPHYRRCLFLVPCFVIAMVWRLNGTSSLADDNGLFWRITQHAGAELLPNISSHLLVSVHLFLEILHYAVWLIALPLIGMSGRFWDIKTVPLARHPRGFPRVVAVMLLFGVVLAGMLWFGFLADYSTTRDVYFTFAIAHVLAEAPFLLRMI
jgi:hypothetical protein